MAFDRFTYAPFCRRYTCVPALLAYITPAVPIVYLAEHAQVPAAATILLTTVGHLAAQTAVHGVLPLILRRNRVKSRHGSAIYQGTQFLTAMSFLASCGAITYNAVKDAPSRLLDQQIAVRPILSCLPVNKGQSLCV